MTGVTQKIADERDQFDAPGAGLKEARAKREAELIAIRQAELARTATPPLVEGEGWKLDAGKDPWDLAPWDAFRAVVKVLRYGADKYAPRNWEKGMAWSRPYGALQRHLTSWWEGERVDPETQMSHLWHAGCCVCFLISYELRGIGTDDRPGNGPGITPRPRTVRNEHIPHSFLPHQEREKVDDGRPSDTEGSS